MGIGLPKHMLGFTDNIFSIFKKEKIANKLISSCVNFRRLV